MEAKMGQAEFSASMFKLRAHYQNGVQDEALWLATVATYWEEFKNRQKDALLRAFTMAWKKHKQWMPSAGELLELIDAAEKTLALSKPIPTSRQLDEPRWSTGGGDIAREIIAQLSKDKAV